MEGKIAVEHREESAGIKIAIDVQYVVICDLWREERGSVFIPELVLEFLWLVVGVNPGETEGDVFVVESVKFRSSEGRDSAFADGALVIEHDPVRLEGEDFVVLARAELVSGEEMKLVGARKFIRVRWVARDTSCQLLRSEAPRTDGGVQGLLELEKVGEVLNLESRVPVPRWDVRQEAGDRGSGSGGTGPSFLALHEAGEGSHV